MKQSYSVLMSVYAKENPEYLKLAIESMLNQTVPTNDFVLVCDGPLTPGLDAVIDTIYNQYPAIFQVVHLERNCGLGNALNTGLKICKNELVARMDSDDISLPYRCELQLREFKEKPELALCSGDIAEFISDMEDIKSIRSVPHSHREIVTFAKRRNPMNHMAVMFKKSAVRRAGGYIEISYVEDYYLWVRMLNKGFKASNIKQILVNARIGNGMHKRRGGFSYIKSIYTLQKKMMEMHFISPGEFIVNCFIRIGGSIIPTYFRKNIYERVLRKNNKIQLGKENDL
ncbi:MAG: glycosyltransferase [Hungatella sp.]|nr:glycosyltransferase [Hungatella sp.]